MSGFEIAGITLAAWPILIEGLKFYAEERGVSYPHLLPPALLQKFPK